MAVRRFIFVASALLVAVLGSCLVAGCGGTKTDVVTAPPTEASNQPASTPTQTGQQGQVTGEPEKVITMFVDAINRGDINAARGFWSANADEADDWFDRRGITVTQVQVTGSGQTAYVNGSVQYTDDDGEDDDGEKETDTFRFTLNRAGDSWTIVDEDD